MRVTPRAVVTGRTAFALLSQSAHAPSRMRSATHTVEEWRGPMECSPDDVPMTLRLELKSVVVFSIMFVRRFSWGGLLCWVLRLATLEQSVHRQALRSKVHLWSCCLRISQRLGVHSTTRRGGAQPHTAQSGPESKRGPNCLGFHPSLFQYGALFRPLPRIIVVTLEGCFCERVNLVVSLDFLPFHAGGCLVKCSMRSDPSDFFHIGPVRVSTGRPSFAVRHSPCYFERGPRSREM